MSMIAVPEKIAGIRPNRFRRHTKATKEDDTIAEPDPIDMFKVLVDISKGYVQLSNLSKPPG